MPGTVRPAQGAAAVAGDLVAGLCALARRYLARIEGEFADAVAAGDFGHAGRVAGEAAALSEALKRQERGGPSGHTGHIGV